ncbi:uncharacterized protein LOC111257729 [Setaria italica]|uniref:uncharacterized protein LOC111257729 n=1 Tax=Setaria italica TaxID=4555 RepID=UPI000BE5BC55|nr:uncharacterized protein LOC111257729 [Setaria italica]
MASSSSTSLQLGQVSKKLTRDNYVLWKAQFLPAFRGAQLLGILEGKVPAPSPILEVLLDGKKKVSNPEYDSWVSKDQQFLSYLLNSITREVLAGVATTTTSTEAWKVLEVMFVEQSRARVTNLQMQLATLKGSLTMAAYFNKMQNIKDELAAAGKSIGDEEIYTHN